MLDFVLINWILIRKAYCFMLDLDKINPNWQLAQAHAKSTRSGKSSSFVQDVQRCPCCFRAIDTIPIGVFEHTKQLQALGLAYPLFFTFLKYSIILICFQVFSYNILELSNGITYDQSYCSASQTQTQGPICSIYFVRIASLDPVVTSQENIMRVCSFIIQLIMLIFIRNRIHKTLKYYEERQTKISDYSVIIKGLPLVPNIREKVYQLFKDFFSQSVNIQECVLIGSLHSYYELKHEKQELFNQIRKLGREKVVSEHKMADLAEQLMKNSQQFQSQTEKMINLNKADQLLCEKVIVVLQSDKIKQQIVQQFSDNLQKTKKIKELQLILGISSYAFKFLKIIRAPQPEQIIWENINIRRSTKIVRQILGWFFTIVFMVAITVIFYLVITQKSKLVQKWSQAIKGHRQNKQESSGSGQNLQTAIIAIVYFFIFFVVLLNKFVISNFLHFISHFEKYSTYAKQEYFFAVKYTITLFLTTAVMTLLVEGVTFHNIDTYQYGVIEQESIMFIINAFFIPFLWLVNPLQLIRIIRRKLNYGKSELTQGEANNLMMDEPASLGKHFAETIEIIWFTFMYSSVIPSGAIVILVGLSINYWVVKYTILKRSAVDHHVSGSFLTLALKLLDVSLIMKPAGELIFDSFIRYGYHISSIVCLLIGGLYFIFPVDWLIDKMHRERFNLHEMSYQEAKSGFVANYNMLHPIYSLKKIFVQKEVERLNLFFPQVGSTSQLALPAGVLSALRRSSWQPQLKPAFKEIEMVELFTQQEHKTEKHELKSGLLS